MNRMDWIILRRLSGRVLVTLIVVFCLFMLLESLDTGRFVYLSSIGGLPLALTSIAASAGRWTIRTLSVTVLIGAIVGILDLQARQELNIIKASGHSVWKLLRAPLVAVIIASAGVSLFLESATTQLDRSLNPIQAGDTGAVTPDGAFWFSQTGQGQRYVMRSGHVQPGGTVLTEVTVFLFDDGPVDRIIADEVRLEPGHWLVASGVGYRADAPPQVLSGLELPTTSTPADLRVRLAATDDLTFFELGAALGSKLEDPILRNAVATRFMRLLTLPLLLAGSVLIAFAFTAGYRRSSKYGAAVLYGIVLGFVVFFVTEMADRAGSAGALDPTFAAVGPALVAIVVGLTVLLYREDGRA
jgi:lipopolysaccharide export system permease protein